MADSKIAWTNKTWNPLAGCTWASPGCDHCYAATMTRRLAAMGQADYAGLTTDKHFNGKIRTRPHRLDEPLQWKKPRMVFVNSMSDLFHKDVPIEFIDQVFAVMNASAFTLPISDRSKRWHTYQVLTKRPQRMAEYTESRRTTNWPRSGTHPLFEAGRGDGGPLRGQGREIMNAGAVLLWPLHNVWLGTSVENQQGADERVPHLLAAKAAVRFLSCEPLIGPVTLGGGGTTSEDKPRGGYYWLTERPCFVCKIEDDLSQKRGTQSHPINCGWKKDNGGGSGGIDWVIVGCESGHHRRPMDPAWARTIRDQCREAGVAFFMKQMEVRGKVTEDITRFPKDLQIREYPSQC